MFVVRLKRPGEESDLKAFASRRAAVARFRTAQSEMIDGEVAECALLEVDAPDATHAVELIAQGRGIVLEANLQDPGAPVAASQAEAFQSSPVNRSSTS